MTICDSYFNTYFLKIKFFGQLLKLFSIVFIYSFLYFLILINSVIKINNFDINICNTYFSKTFATTNVHHFCRNDLFFL